MEDTTITFVIAFALIIVISYFVISYVTKYDRLMKAVMADNVKKVYKMLKKGTNPNFIWEDDYGTERCPMDMAEIYGNEPMKRLLKAFGALDFSEVKKREEEREKLLYQKERQKEELKKKKDEAFLNKVLKA